MPGCHVSDVVVRFRNTLEQEGEAAALAIYKENGAPAPASLLTRERRPEGDAWVSIKCIALIIGLHLAASNRIGASMARTIPAWRAVGALLR